MESLIVILGITGNQGASVADVFLKEKGWKLRGITRDVTKQSSQTWSQKGVEMVQADLNNPESLRKAFEGAKVIFAVTDFWTPMYDLYNYGKLRQGQSISEFCYDLELQQGKNVADAAASIETLERFVFSGLVNIKNTTKGKYTWVYHFDAKAAVMEYIKTSLPDLNRKSSELQLAEYATNWRVWKLRQLHKQDDGTFAMLLPGDSMAGAAFVVPRIDTGYFVRALVNLPPGKKLLGYGSFLNHEEYVRIWTGILGVPNGGVKRITVEEAAAFEGGPHGRGVAETFASVLEVNFLDDSFMHPRQIPNKEIECPTTNIEEYLKSQDFSSMLQRTP
ncbi:uncharacterized protein N7483_006185 [Penicillium malachiteum]|uniref:uncharacterized protein n=1 Tax=Penicillium malachiteum TaxID=1324776 RepID=UPI0025475E7E|nr:uncharacterized protein N7483_006185 [Penicillium malachiteum]KAJ5731677.1 hypothetical protein N7483_006185 [Penicillium malachiteum]